MHATCVLRQIVLLSIKYCCNFDLLCPIGNWEIVLGENMSANVTVSVNRRRKAATKEELADCSKDVCICSPNPFETINFVFNL